ncbi:hypothetical protein AWH60_01315 [Pseudoalteromonas haloplanktis]|nr:hypothetical protein AWH60_01315 [Pseudoalteromonas haloplanktis]
MDSAINYITIKHPHQVISFIAWLCALVVMLIGLFTPNNKEILLFLTVSSLCLLMFNSVAISAWVFHQFKDKQLRFIAVLCSAALMLCTVGDVINFNLSQHYHRYATLIKHDYLIDSILFFAPGYSLLFLACVLAYKRQQAISQLKSILFMVVVLVISATSLASMYLDGAGIPILAMTGAYSVVVTAVALMGLVLVVAYGGFYAPKSIIWVSLGLFLAALADAIIGAFWIYGNQGQGFYPQVRYINWFIYISSQCLVIHLAKVVALAK